MSFRKKIEHYFLKYLAVPRTPEVLPGKIHIACLGDSITFGAGVNGKKEETWEYCLNQILGDRYQVINYGISGRTLQDEGDYPYKADKFYPISKETKSEIYLIMLGTNDAKPYNWNAERYERELHAFLKEYLDLEHRPEVILMSPPHCFKDKKTGIVLFDIEMDNIDGPIQEIVRRQAELLGIRLIDLYACTEEQEDWFADGVHPNAFGNRKIAEHIARYLYKN